MPTPTSTINMTAPNQTKPCALPIENCSQIDLSSLRWEQKTVPQPSTLTPPATRSPSPAVTTPLDSPSHSSSASTSYFPPAPSWHPLENSSFSFRFDSDFERSQSPSFAADNVHVHAREFETAFCRDFYCCGLRLLDLHDLLQHYEECHVRFEEDDEDFVENDSEFFDEDGWSDSDSAPSSPSSASPSGSDLNSSVVPELGAAVNHLHQSFPHHYPAHLLASRTNPTLTQHPLIHSTHPLYRRPSSNISASDVEAASRNSTTHALEAFNSSLNGPSKRKAVVSLADIYAEDENDGHGDHSSAFSNAILRSRPNGSTIASDFLGPMAKRQAVESNQRSTASSIYSDMHSAQTLEKNHGGLGPYPFHTGNMTTSTSMTSHPDPASLNPSVYPAANGRMGPIGPLTTTRPLAMNSTNSPYVTAAVDLMRQRDEVFSLMEDLTRTGNTNTSDKPYRCSVLGCDKAYKNPNGLKYHNLHGHCSTGGMGETDSPETKPYVCTFLECGKRYKNLNGLKYHIEHSHPNLTAALRAHQSGLINPHIFGPYPSQAAMTIAAALQAVNSSPMMMAAANAIMTAQAANAANAANAAAAAAAAGVSHGEHDAGPVKGGSLQLTGAQGVDTGSVSGAGLGQATRPAPFNPMSTHEGVDANVMCKPEPSPALASMFGISAIPNSMFSMAPSVVPVTIKADPCDEV
ncbi:Transcriptional regulator of ribosomal biogenesis proteins [Linnemannia elongata]|nr:Transcriptional regulator of ribosomal biogenesis proteins [Linnemannia elongata]